MENNKSIYRSDEQRNLYKALVGAYESDKLILDTYGDTVSFKRRRDDEDKDEEPSARSNRGSKRRRAGKELESTSAPKKKTSKTTGKSTEGSKSHHKSAGESTQAEEPMHTAKDLEEPKPAKPPTPDRDWNKTLLDAHGPVQPWLSSLAQMEDPQVYKATTDQLDWNNPEGQQYPYDLRKPLPLIPNSRGRRVIPFDHLINNDLAYLSGKLTNLSIEERLAFNVSLRMFTRSFVIQRYMEDLQLGVESYQKKLNLTKPDTYRSDLKRREAYTAYSNPRGFIYQNKDKKNRLMRIDELHKFSDGTLNDVRTALDDRLKGIRMKYLPQTIWRQSDRDKAGAMIQAIDKQLKTRRIMRSLEKFVGGRPYEDVEFDESDTHVLERFDNSAGNPVKEILLKLNLPDHRILKDGGEDATLKLFKSTNQERYEPVGPEVTRSHGGKIYKMAKRDYAWLMISRCSRSHSRQAKEQAQDLKSMITTSNHKIND
ncbi:hypothetical protein Tco_1427818 [Tanacetum coccineum]